MPQFEIVKMGNGEFRGFGNDDHDRYEKFRRFLKEKAEPGELVSIKWWQEPDPILHRKMMAMFRLAFDHWDPAAGRKRRTHKGVPIEKNFEQFRKDILIQAGFFEATYDHRGRLHLEAKSLAYGKMSDDEKREAYDKVLSVLLEHVLTNYKRGDVERVVAELEKFN